MWGVPASTIETFNHMNAGAPCSAISVCIFLKLRILSVGVPVFSLSRFSKYNNPRMLFKISRIFCQDILADFPGPPIPSSPFALFMQL